MLTFNTPQLRELVKSSDPNNHAAAAAVDKIDFLEFPEIEQSVKSDVEYLKESPLVLPKTEISGWVYEVGTGQVSVVTDVSVLPNCSIAHHCRSAASSEGQANRNNYQLEYLRLCAT